MRQNRRLAAATPAVQWPIGKIEFLLVFVALLCILIPDAGRLAINPLPDFQFQTILL